MRREAETAPCASYFARHALLTPEVRAAALAWAIQVCDQFGLEQETLFLAASYLDRFLSATAVRVLRGMGDGSGFIEACPRVCGGYATASLSLRLQFLAVRHLGRPLWVCTAIGLTNSNSAVAAPWPLTPDRHVLHAQEVVHLDGLHLATLACLSLAAKQVEVRT
jgi:hypothetical protein